MAISLSLQGLFAYLTPEPSKLSQGFDPAITTPESNNWGQKSADNIDGPDVICTVGHVHSMCMRL